MPTPETPAAPFADAPPWPEPVADMEPVLCAISDLIDRHMSIEPAARDTVVLWAAMSHCHQWLNVSPYLHVTSPTKRCGKSVLLELLSYVVRRPLPIGGTITASAMSRLIDAHGPTIMLDEADTYLAADRALRGLMNGAQRRNTANTIRLGPHFTPTTLSTWSPKLLCGIGGLPDTLQDRCICVRLQRAEAKIPPISDATMRDLRELRRQVARWTLDERMAILGALERVDAPMLHARAMDAWRPLLAIGDVAGMAWRERAAQAAQAAAGFDMVPSKRLLIDIRSAMDAAGEEDAMSSVAVLRALGAKEPWSTWTNGRPLSAQMLSELLPSRLKPRNMRVGGRQLKCIPRPTQGDLAR